VLALITATALAFNQDGWQVALDAHVDDGGRVDYAALRGLLDGHLAELARASEAGSPGERKAFWINAYNALTVDLVADSWPISSVLDLDGGKVWDTRRFTVAGKLVTLNDIEHRILRPLGDPRVHATLNCASNGCPPLSRTAFGGKELEAQLDDAARRWMATNGVRLDRSAGTVHLNRIFDWYAGDFPAKGVDVPGVEGKALGAAAFAARYLSTEDAQWLLAGGYAVAWAEYDWRVNARR
jgi:hypothetical protein